MRPYPRVGGTEKTRAVTEDDRYGGLVWDSIHLRPLISQRKETVRLAVELIMECGIVLVNKGVAMVTNKHIKEMANRHGGKKNALGEKKHRPIHLI